MTINVWAQVGYNHQQIGGECPEGWVEMVWERPTDEDNPLYTAQADGTWAVTKETLDAIQVRVESAWVEAEKTFVADNLLYIEDGNPKATAPLVKKTWCDYRWLVMDWDSTNPDFPDSTKRPVRPA